MGIFDLVPSPSEQITPSNSTMNLASSTGTSRSNSLTNGNNFLKQIELDRKRVDGNNGAGQQQIDSHFHKDGIITN